MPEGIEMTSQNWLDFGGETQYFPLHGEVAEWMKALAC